MKRLLFLICSISNFSHAQDTLIYRIKEAYSNENQKELGEVYRKKGIKYKNKGQYSNAEKCYYESLRIYTALNDSSNVGNVLNNLGLLFFTKYDNNAALEYYYRSVKINEECKNSIGLTKNYLNLGNFFFSQKDFSLALDYYYQCREELVDINNGYLLASTHLGIGNIFSHRDYDQKQLVKAQSEYLSALHIYKQLEDSLSLSKVYNNLGTISFDQKKYVDAFNYFNQGLFIKEQINDQKGVMVTYLNMGSALEKQKDFSQSLKFYKRGKGIAKEISDAEDYLHIIYNMVNVYMELGKADSAATLFAEYNELRDSVFNEEKSRQLTELQTQYETEKTTKELELQKIATQEKTSLNRILFIVLFSLGLLSVAVIVLFLQRQKVIKKLRNKEDELHKQEVTRLQKEQDIQSLHAMMEGQQQERQRIAEDLHDRLGAKLSAIKLFHESSRADINKFDKVDEMLNETIIETREIAHNLAPSVLTKYGLVQALQDLLETLQSTNKIQTQFSSTNLNKRLPEGVETALYYIVQELVTNTLRHSGADSLSISMSCHDDGLLNLCYEDNGKGFDPSSLPKDSMGLRNMRTRLAPFAGILSIDAVPNHGATFIIDISLLELSV
jgi:signal transduction histidine kinase